MTRQRPEEPPRRSAQAPGAPNLAPASHRNQCPDRSGLSARVISESVPRSRVIYDRLSPRPSATVTSDSAAGPSPCCGARVPGEGRRRHDPVRLSLELQRHCPRAPGIRGRAGMFSPLEVALRLFSSFLRGCSLWGRRKIHPRTSGFREPDGDGLLRGARAMFSRANVLDLFVNEFARLRRCRFSVSLVLSHSGQRYFVRHDGLQ